MRFLLTLFLISALITNCKAQAVSNETSRGFWMKAPEPDKKRIRLLNYAVAGTYGISMSWLYTQWYKDYPTTGFHFFNDGAEWLQMDKGGHLWDSYNIAKPLTRVYEWAGIDHRKATWYGTGIALAFQTTVEVFDGFSKEWGFSSADLLCNVAGAAAFASQELIWKEQKITLKYSFHQTKYSAYRPDLLGSSLPENILKDYNGLTYWVCINPTSLFSFNNFPSWLSLVVGYGAEGMTGGRNNPVEVNGRVLPQFERYRQYYLSLDIDLRRIETGSRFLRSVFDLVNIIRLPAPAIEFSPSRAPVYHWIYF